MVSAKAVGDGVAVGNGGKTSTGLDEIKTDFHITLKTDTNMTLDGAHISLNGGALVAPSSVTGDGTNQIELNWVGFGFGKTDVVRYSYVVTEETKNQIDVTNFFTPKDSPTDIPTLGWEVTNSGDVFLQNGSDAAIHFANLLFQMPPTLTESSLLALVDAAPSGVPGFVSSGDVAAAGPGGDPGRLLVGHFPLNPGDVLTATMDTSFTDSSFSAITQTESLGHEHPTAVPEPTTFTLLGLGSLLLAARQSRRKRAVPREKEGPGKQGHH
jgi:hypothetical protein